MRPGEIPQPSAERVFLGWDDPPLPMVAAWVIDYAPPITEGRSLDLSKTLIVLEGARARRMLLAQLAHESGKRRAALVPPLLVDPSETASLLLDHESSKPAGPCITSIAWREAVRQLSTEHRLALAPASMHDPDAWHTPLATVLAQTCELLTRHAITPRSALHQIMQEQLADSETTTRWEALIDAHDKAKALIEASGRVIPEEASLLTISSSGSENIPARLPYEHAVLVCPTDLTPLTRSALALLTPRIHALVAALRTDAELFDELGTPSPAWRDRPISLGDKTITFPSDAQSQACESLGVLLEASDQYAAQEMLIATPDAESRGAIVREARLADGVAVHDAAAPSLSTSRPATFLSYLAAYIASGTFDALTRLLRHPDAPIVFSENDPSLSDRALAEMLDAADISPPTRTSPWSPPRAAPALDALLRILEQAASSLRGARRAANEWAVPIRAALSACYQDVEFNSTDDYDARSMTALEALVVALDDLSDLKDTSPLTAKDCIDAILNAIDHPSSPRTSAPHEVDLVGFLEILLDPAKVLVIAGAVEGSLPSRVQLPALLDATTANALGLPQPDARLGRDAYILSAAQACRKEFRIFAHRRNLRGDPLLPSRLLLREPDDGALRQRILDATAPASAPRVHLPTKPAPVTTANSAFPLRPDLGEPVPESLSISDLKLFLNTPYEFYLRRVAKLHDADPPQRELPPTSFGDLVHETLAVWGNSQARHSANAEEIESALLDALHDEARRRFCGSASPIVGVQIEIARRRLEAFATIQAERRASGWVVHHAEGRESLKQKFMIDDSPIEIRGRIDRIDRHESSGKYAILDYKTSGNARTPDTAHVSSGEWVDLQLPLYRYLARELTSSEFEQVELGYINLPASLERTGFEIARWSKQEEADAYNAFQNAVVAIRNREFDAPARRDPKGTPARASGTPVVATASSQVITDPTRETKR